MLNDISGMIDVNEMPDVSLAGQSGGAHLMTLEPSKSKVTAVRKYMWILLPGYRPSIFQFIN